MAMGLQDLVMFRDNLQQPEMTGMDNLRNLQALTMRSMADQNYANMAFGGLVDNMVDPDEAMRYAASGGIVSLPVVQAGFGGFLKKVFKTAAKLPGMQVLGKAIVKPLSKSKVGRIALSAAPLLLSGGNPALAAAIAAGIKIAGDPNQEGNPYRVLQSAGKTYVAGKIGQSLKGTPGPGETSQYATGIDDPSRFTYQPGSEVIGTPPTPTLPPAPETFGGKIRESLFTDIDRPGTLVSREVVDPIAEFLKGGTAEAQADKVLTEQQDIPQFTRAVQKSQEQARAGLETPSLLSKAGDFLKTGKGKLAAGTAVLGGLSALGGEEQIPQDQLDMAGLTVETDFDKQRFVYRDAEGNPLTTAQALQMIQTASQGFGEGGQRMASGVRGAFERVDDPVLSASGGLIGMAYGGSMPMNNMDVKYKEFSGMVGGRGDGMEDNVYMPIVEGESGQQVATLAVSPKEYVVDANTMSLLGNGNPDEGAEIMDKTVKDIRKAATGQTKQQKEIDGLAALNRMRRSV